MATTAHLTITADPVQGQDGILTSDALAFIAELETKFGARRRDVLKNRVDVQARLDAGGTLDFLAETADIRAGDWRVRPAPADLQDRRVEITGPVDRKMVINALNAGAKCFMADFEDSSTPSWENMISGQINLRDANARAISFENPDNGKQYRLNDTVATLLVRPRGWHMDEAHVTLDGTPISASLFDFGLYLFHNAKSTAANGSGPYFYLPKMEHHLEARLWNEVIDFAEDTLGLARGTVRCTVLIETITAAFQMDEILFELKDHIVGLNCGRWDYIFNFIKRHARNVDFVLPNRDDVTMATHFLTSYSLLLIQTCHKRGAHAMGGMAAQIPVKGDVEANAAAIEKVRADKVREAENGHDGTWVAHPALVPVAMEVFDAAMPGPNQLDNLRSDVTITAADLLAVPTGSITEAGMRRNISIGLQYLANWLQGLGCAPIFNLMEDAATAEISRTQMWQWRVHGTKTDDGRTIDAAMLTTLIDSVTEEVRAERPDFTRLDDAKALFVDLVMNDELEEFLTTPAYAKICAYERAGGL